MILDSQEKQLCEEIEEIEEALCGFKVTCGVDENQRELLKNLQQQLNEQKQDWDNQKQLTQGEEKKVCAAQFPTQKFMHTITDFERQANGRNKIQNLLLNMLTEKCKQRQLVRKEISTVTNELIQIERPDLVEIFFNENDSAETPTYYSCSSLIAELKEPPITKTASGTIQEQRNR